MTIRPSTQQKSNLVVKTQVRAYGEEESMKEVRQARVMRAAACAQTMARNQKRKRLRAMKAQHAMRAIRDVARKERARCCARRRRHGVTPCARRARRYDIEQPRSAAAAQ